MKIILVTGAAGFIGMHTSQALAQAGYTVIGIDNLNDYYSTQLKKDRLKLLSQYENFKFIKIDITNSGALERLFNEHSIDNVINLAAQAGIRYSIKNPRTYIKTNIVGFSNLLECCRRYGVAHIIYASSSSVYGRNTKIPFTEKDTINLPANIYAATKISNELMAEAYSHLYGLTCTGLRLFTVYGPWGRPDMAYFSFTEHLHSHKMISLFNGGKHRRDMTYIDDIVDGIIGALHRKTKKHRIYNLGNQTPIELLEMVSILEELTQIKGNYKHLPMQVGDIHETYADITAASRDLGYKPHTTLSEGLNKFVEWYKVYYL